MSKPTEQLLHSLRNYFEPLGLETYLFKVSWYNDLVDNAFKFEVSRDTVCAVLLSIPSFFENAFLPYIQRIEVEKLAQDPIDSCIAYYVNCVRHLSSDIKMTVMYDYELLPNRRPKVLVQTAAHVAGAAFYYQRKHVTQVDDAVGNAKQSSFKSDLSVHNTNFFNNEKGNASMQHSSGVNEVEHTKARKDPWGGKRMFGCCVHPVYGGWFAIRCVIIFPDIIDSELKFISPIDCVSKQEDRIELLKRFNFNWQDSTYRDIIPVKVRYSDLQKFYFATLPKDRKNLLMQMLTIT